MFENRQQLAELLTQLMSEHNLTMLEALVHISEHYKIEEEQLAIFIRQSHKLKEQLKQEAIGLKMLRNESV